MKRILLLFISAGYFPVVLAQGQQEVPVMQFAADSTRYLLYQTAKYSPTLIHQLMPAGYNTASLGYSYTSGDYVAAQGATTDKTITFHTEGKTNVGKTDLWGSFNYERIVEDSTHFAHQSRNNTSTPYYYGSSGYVSYHRTVYKASVLGQHRFFQEHMPVVGGIDYRIGDHFGVNDPRGNVRDFQFDMNGGTGYSWKDRLTATVHGYYGYGSEVINISYKNDLYRVSLADTSRSNWLINGYGEPKPKLTNADYRTRFRRQGVGFTLLYQQPVLGTLVLTAKQIKEKQFYFYRYDGGYDTLAYYNLNTTTLHALWSKGKLAATFDYESQEGEDFNVSINANNYQYRYKMYAFRVVYTGRVLNYGLQVRQNEEQRLSGTTGNQYRYEHITLQPSVGWNHTTKKQDHIGVDLAVNYTTSVDPFLFTNVNESGYFSKQVMFYDFYYNAASSAGGKLSIQYTKHFKGFYAGLKGTAGYTEAFNQSDVILTGAKLPGTNRSYGNIALQFYF